MHYAYNQQMYGADSDHATLFASLDYELSKGLQWFWKNGLMANPSKLISIVSFR